MSNGRRIWLWTLALALMASPGFAQGGGTTTTLAGVVQDKDGGFVPGATVVVKNNATAVSQTAVTGATGTYSVPALEAGTYTVTISLQGFKTAVVSDVRLLAATPANLRTVLEIGALTETIEVRGGTELIRTQTPTVSSTVSTELINSLPVSSRSALNFMIFLPGVETPGGAGNSRSSTISGLPQNTINITIDGVSNSNMLQSGDGFFTMVTPRLDAVEEVSLTSATAGADSSAQGATQIRFVTRSGTNRLDASIYEYFRHSSLNTNAFFNRAAGLPRPRVTVNQYGGRIGGPIVIPGLVDARNRAFFFFNWEESWQPNETRRTRTIMNEQAQQGLFRYNLTNPTSVNVLALAAANGQLASQDPTIQALLAQIRGAVRTTGTITPSLTNLNVESFAFLTPVESTRRSPTMKVDVNIGQRHKLTGTYYWQKFSDSPDTLNSADPVFPGFSLQGGQSSYRTSFSSQFRSTLTSNLVNEVSIGSQWSPLNFFSEIGPDMYTNQGFFNLNLNGAFGISNVTPGDFGNAPGERNTSNWNIDDKLNWLRGNHSYSFGFSFSRINNWTDDWNVVPNMSFAVNTTNDPAAGLFNTTNFPGASTGDLNSARGLYALLTGRVSSIGATARLNSAGTEYVYNGHIYQTERMDEYGIYAQDNWRMTPTITLTYGLRWQLQMPMVPTNGTFTKSTLEDLCGPSGFGNGVGGRQCNIFNPGVLNNAGQIPTYLPYDPNSPGYNIDYNNFAPNVGVAWRPNAQQGFFRTLLGDPDQATVTSGYTRSYNRERLDRFLNVFGSNPGASTPATRSTAATAFPLVPPGEPWPILLRETHRLGPPDFPTTPSFPITASFAAGQDIRVFDPDLEIPFTDSWTVGLQRALNRDTVVEVRYVGNQNKRPWSTENWNVENIYENGFKDEFVLAQANLKANVLAGRGGSFAYFGPGTGTSPLPIFLSHFTGLPAAAAGNAASYTVAAFANNAQFTNSTYTDDLDYLFPDPAGIAASLWTGNSGTWRTNGQIAGLPTTFWVMNSLVDDAVVTRNLGGSKYHSLQVDLRRRLSRGFVVQGSYTFAREFLYNNRELHLPLLLRRDPNVPHAFKMLWSYDVPVGRGKRFGANMNPWVDGVVGGWTFSGLGRVQRPNFRLTNTQIVGMSHDEAQDAFTQIRIERQSNGTLIVYNMPQDIIDNTRRAYDTDPTHPTGYAGGQLPTGRYFAPASSEGCMALYAQDCAPDTFFNGGWFAEYDFKLVKKFQLPGRAYFQVDVEVFNAFNATNFNRQLNPGAGATIFNSTSAGSGARVGQLALRVTW